MNLDVLVVAPHPDDAELGMGGAIMKMLSQGTAVAIWNCPIDDWSTRLKRGKNLLG